MAAGFDGIIWNQPWEKKVRMRKGEHMDIIGTLTPGTVLFLTGTAIFAAAVLMSLVMMVTSKRRKRKMEERMKEKY